MNYKKKPLLISIVVPCYNESSVVSYFFDAIIKIFDAAPNYDFEVIFVDDGSKDDTLIKIIEITNQDSRFKAVELSRNFGKEAALSAGIEVATGHAVIPMDADLQDPPKLIFQMIEKWQKGADVVLAKRIDRKTDSYLKRLTAKWFYKTHNHLSAVKIHENVGDFRLMDRRVVDALKQLTENQRFMKGLFSWVGFRTEIVEYSRPERVSGDTKFSGWRLWNLALEGITSFSTLPLRVWTYIGVFFGLSAIAYAIFIFFGTIFIGKTVPGYSSILIIVLFMGSIQLISIGVIGEYLGRVYAESKGRPAFLIRQIYANSNLNAKSASCLDQ